MENGSRRLQALVFHSPRLPAWNRGETAIREQLEISWLLWSGRADRQSSLGNGSGHFGFAERILPVFAQGLFFASCGSGGRESTGRHPSAREPRSIPTIEYVLKKNARTWPLHCPSRTCFFDLRRRDRILLENPTGETLWRERLEGNYFASPVLVNGKVCIVSRKVSVRVYRSQRKK